MSRRLIFGRRLSAFLQYCLNSEDLIRYYPMFPWAIPNPKADYLRVTHPFATLKRCKHLSTVRLACLKRAASVRSEPGSNSPLYNFQHRSAEAYFSESSRSTGHFDLLYVLASFGPFLFYASFPSLMLSLKDRVSVSTSNFHAMKRSHVLPNHRITVNPF